MKRTSLALTALAAVTVSVGACSAEDPGSATEDDALTNSDYGQSCLAGSVVNAGSLKGSYVRLTLWASPSEFRRLVLEFYDAKTGFLTHLTELGDIYGRVENDKAMTLFVGPLRSPTDIGSLTIDGATTRKLTALAGSALAELVGTEPVTVSCETAASGALPHKTAFGKRQVVSAGRKWPAVPSKGACVATDAVTRGRMTGKLVRVVLRKDKKQGYATIEYYDRHTGFVAGTQDFLIKRAEGDGYIFYITNTTGEEDYFDQEAARLIPKQVDGAMVMTIEGTDVGPEALPGPEAIPVECDFL